MSALARLKARLEQKAPSDELTKPTKPPSVSFVSTDPAPFSKNRVQESANDPVKPTAEVLCQFRFDLTDEDIAADIAAGYPATDIVRVNNMAWEFMQHDGMTFSEAIREAAKRVTDYSIMECEAAYEDVQALWRRMKGAA